VEAKLGFTTKSLIRINSNQNFKVHTVPEGLPIRLSQDSWKEELEQERG
jgi:hypothetical protein